MFMLAQVDAAEPGLGGEPATRARAERGLSRFLPRITHRQRAWRDRTGFAWANSWMASSTRDDVNNVDVYDHGTSQDRLRHSVHLLYALTNSATDQP